jgi:hypothetical protein
MKNPKKIAIIGSFRQHYEPVRSAIATFSEAGFIVTSPLGDDVVKPGINFVRFTSDDTRLDDATVQTIALHRILGADFIYVVAPFGYVGRTTCYEIGRVVQARKPVLFSERPTDLPVRVPDSHVLSPVEAALAICSGSAFSSAFAARRDDYEELEDDLTIGRIRAI